MPEPRRLYVHVGLQKTGTSYLQRAMRENLDQVTAQGLDLVPATTQESFHVMLVVRGRFNPDHDPAEAGKALTRFAEQLVAATGDRALLSQESLAAATPEQIQRLLAAAGDREVHLVATVRDLARQLPSSWQQSLKAGGTIPYDRYLKRLQRMEARSHGDHPWIHLDSPAVLGRWAEAIPPDRIHVITVPPSGSDPSELLRRFCRVLAVDPDPMRAAPTAGNTSLGRAQVELLRRVNSELPKEVLRRQVYGNVGKRFFAMEVLGSQDRRRILVPEEFWAWCDDVSSRQIEALAGAGYRVEGDVEDLRPVAASFSNERAEPDEREVAAAAVTALARMLTLRARSGRRSRRRRTAAGRGNLVGRLLRRVRQRPRS